MHFAFLFPGQGSQFPGMGANYLKEFPYIREYFLEASEILHFDIMNLCLNGPESQLNLTQNAQPSILVLSYCSFQILQKETDFRPFIMAGHSLGEISALCCAGAISFTDAVAIVRKRGELMQLAVKNGNGAMTALNGLPIEEVEKLCALEKPGGCAVISNINSERQIVVSGLKESVEAIGNKARLMGAVTIPLRVSAPFHSPLMKPAAEGLEDELNKYKFRALAYPVISNLTCKPYLDENDIIPLLTGQVTSEVNWLKIMSYIGKTCVDITLELPPKKTLTKLFQLTQSKIKNYSFDQLEELKTTLNGVINN
ncbi:MAG TPA: ACP S-malonyltransferase [Ignavibacteriales bacterium]|nr:ACP S-malonyltransferase [Ignavibacteriales bacterium]